MFCDRKKLITSCEENAVSSVSLVVVYIFPIVLKKTSKKFKSSVPLAQ